MLGLRVKSGSRRQCWLLIDLYHAVVYDWGFPTTSYLLISDLCPTCKKCFSTSGSPYHKQTEDNPTADYIYGLYQNADIRLGLHPYDHMPQYKVLKVFIYIWQRSDMSMKWVRCSYHNLQYIASEKPRELPTSTLTVRPSIIWLGLHPYDHKP